MGLVSSKEMLIEAREGAYAIPAFNIHNLETIQAISEAASECNSPLIIAATPRTLAYAGHDYLLAIVKVSANRYNIPIAVHLDHSEDVLYIKRLIEYGYTSVMIDASKFSFEKNIKIVQEVTDYARQYGVSVEAELGRLSGQEDNIEVSDRESFLTDPGSAAEFVKETGIDSLAVAIGTAHGLYKAEPELDFKRLEEIYNKVEIPLVLHGGSGVPADDIERAMKLGISKINIATELKIPFATAVKEYFYKHPHANDPRDYMAPGREAMKKAAIEKILLCGSDGKA